MKAILFGFVGVLGLNLVACGSAKNERTTRQQTSGGMEYALPEREETLPKIVLEPIELDEESALSLSDDDGMQALLREAGRLIESGIYAGNNVFAAGVGYWSYGKTGNVRCVKVQVQQRLNGKILVKDELVPAGQPAQCSAAFNPGVTTATLSMLVKYGTNWAAGIGAGIVYNDGRYVAGCAYGAVGVKLQNANATGAIGGFCTQILDMATGKVY